jgi:hypothetical protein
MAAFDMRVTRIKAEVKIKKSINEMGDAGGACTWRCRA